MIGLLLVSNFVSTTIKKNYELDLVSFFLVVLVFFELFFALVELAFLVTLFLELLAFLVVDLADELFLVLLDLPGKARQCALVLLPFLFTEALRHVHEELLEEHAELLKPTHALCALDVLIKLKLNAQIAHKLTNIFLITSAFLPK